MKVIVTILSVLLLFSLSACSSSGGSSGGSTSQNQSQTNKTTQNTDTSNKSKSNNYKSNYSSSSSTKSPSTDAKSSNSNQGSHDTFYGQWQINLFITASKSGTYSVDQRKTLEGKKLMFSKDRATCFGDKISSMNNTLSNPVYKKSVLSDKAFQSKYGVLLNQLPGIQGNSITEVDVTGTNGVCNVFFTTHYNNMLILYGGGNFFVLEPPNLTPSDVKAINEPKGAWVDTFEKTLFKNDHVIPSRYKSIGNGYWQVWVREVNTGQQYGFVTVNQKTGNFHG